MKKNSPTVFHYKGIDKQDKKISGEIQAENLATAKNLLRKQGIITSKLVKQRRSLFDKKNKKITLKDRNIFTRQLATMTASGIPLVQSLNTIAKGQSKKKLIALIEIIKNDVETGCTFAASLSKHPAYFNSLFCSLVNAGEQSGTLDLMLDKIANYKEKMETIKKNIKKTLTYPLALISMALLVTTSLLLFVVPQFESLFKGFGAHLPFITQAIVNLSKYFQAYWYWMLLLLGCFVSALIYAHKHSSNFVYNLDKILLKCPLIGSILKKTAISRFARTLAITLAAGLPLIEALEAVAGAAGNRIYSQAIEQIREEICTGLQFNTALEHTKVFPHLIIQMVAIGEESGALEKMLSKAADFYEEEVDNSVEILNSSLEPIIMVILGVLIGGLIIAMYLPIFQLGSL